MPRSVELDQFREQDIQEITMTLSSTPQKCLGFKTPIKAILAELRSNL